MAVYRESASLDSSHGRATFHDVTDVIHGVVTRSGIGNGIVSVYSHHTTCSVITQEAAFDMSMTGLETLQQDFVDVLAGIVPTQEREGQYLHPGAQALEFAAEHGEDARGCHNADAHLRSAILGRSESLALIDGSIDLGEFARVYFLDLDQTRARTRVVQITVVGE